MTPQALRRELLDQLTAMPATTSDTITRALLRLLIRSRALPAKNIDATASPDQLIQQLVQLCSGTPARADALADALEYVTWTGQPEAVSTLRTLSDLLAARTLMADEDLHHLQVLIEPRTVPDLHGLAQACLPPLAASLPQHCTSAWPTALHLLRRNVLPGGLPPLLAFIEHVAAVQQSATTARTLQEWTQDKAEQWGVLEELHSSRSAAARYATAAPAPAPRVMLVFLPDGLRSDLYTLRTWHREGDTETSPSVRDEDAQVDFRDLANTVYKLLQRWTQRLSTSTSSISVEFWLPLTLVNQPVWEWCTQADPSQTAPSWHVIVRSLDRLQTPTLHSPWRTRWQSLMDDSTRPSTASQWLPLHQPGKQPDLVVLSAPPDDEAGRSELLAAIRSGAPAILWHREDCRSLAFQTSVQHLIEQGPLKELPSRVSALRQGNGPYAAKADEDAVRGISLLWDDPDRPLPAMPALVAPSEAL
ncbi:hypothetical protein [Streptomyces sp. NBC_00105]|uniref:VMAP-C domain-containing protein n=1 Tax=Streptomyces sp. NBC_00105 TaxID=2903622 RepID=UPI00324F17FD